MSNRTELSIELGVAQFGESKISTIVVEFPDNCLRSIRTFEPDRLYLEDMPGQRYGLVDSEGFRYCGVEKHEPWVDAAIESGAFLLVMQSGLPEGQVAGRIMVVRYPFGQIIRDSSTFQTDARDFNMAVRNGQLIQKAFQGIRLSELNEPSCCN